ncbi:hypothetical protein FKM82_017869 [Ascaphus truei]
MMTGRNYVIAECQVDGRHLGGGTKTGSGRRKQPKEPPTTGPAEMKSRLHQDPNKSEGSQVTFKTARIEAPRTTDE